MRPQVFIPVDPLVKSSHHQNNNEYVNLDLNSLKHVTQHGLGKNHQKEQQGVDVYLLLRINSLEYISSLEKSKDCPNLKKNHSYVYCLDVFFPRPDCANEACKVKDVVYYLHPDVNRILLVQNIDDRESKERGCYGLMPHSYQYQLFVLINVDQSLRSHGC